MTARTDQLWRVFPWDPEARPGERFTASFVPRPSGTHRFDLPAERSRVLYLAQSPEHAVAEYIQGFRGRSISQGHLLRDGHGLALTRISCAENDRDRLVDLCDPSALDLHELAPDLIASRERDVTQPLAQRIWDLGYAGLRWWSSFWGDWHTVVLFVERLEGELEASEPEVLTLDTPALRAAADALEIRLS